MARERRDFVRRAGFRDATLFVVATEGAETEQRYFNGLKERWRSPRIHVELVARDDASQSSPERVLESLEQFVREWKLRDGDQLWLVIDRDRWRSSTLASVARKCEKKQYRLAVSNPCFELWLLIHFENVPNQSADRKRELFENKQGLLKRHVAAHHRPNIDFVDHYFHLTATAIGRSQALDIAPNARWPNGLGTRVYRLIKELRPDDA